MKDFDALVSEVRAAMEDGGKEGAVAAVNALLESATHQRAAAVVMAETNRELSSQLEASMKEAKAAVFATADGHVGYCPDCAEPCHRLDAEPFCSACGWNVPVLDSDPGVG